MYNYKSLNKVLVYHLLGPLLADLVRPESLGLVAAFLHLHDLALGRVLHDLVLLERRLAHGLVHRLADLGACGDNQADMREMENLNFAD